jgi:nucleotide-binding universal stress UspA family protein
VGPDADGDFRRAVVALDFGVESVRAAALACRLLSPRGTLSLVHVKRPLTLGGPEGEAWDARCSAQIADLFRRLVAVLRDGGAAPTARDGRVVPSGGAPCVGRRDVTIGTVTLVGEPVTELLTYAATVGADLVAIGRHSAPCVADPRVADPRVADPVDGSVSAALAQRVLGTLEETCMLVCPAASSAPRAGTADPRARPQPHPARGARRRPNGADLPA